MLGLEILKWWYTAGWGLAAKRLFGLMGSIMADFSVPTLLRTLFSPWKRIITTPGPNAGLAGAVKAIEDNLISRVVGMNVRLFIIFCAVLLGLLTVFFGAAFLLVWPLIPLTPLVLLILGGGQ